MERATNRKINTLTPRPPVFAIIKVDGKWAQVIAGGNTIRYLDDSLNKLEIDWKTYKYQFDKNFLTIKDLVEAGEISNAEYLTISLASEKEGADAKFRDEVKVFGIYEKK